MANDTASLARKSPKDLVIPTASRTGAVSADIALFACVIKHLAINKIPCANQRTKPQLRWSRMVSLGAAKVKPSNSYHQQTFRQIKISFEPSPLHRVKHTKTSSAWALEA
jgi:hypothetical protein